MIFKGHIIPFFDAKKGLIYAESLSEKDTKDIADRFYGHLKNFLVTFYREYLGWEEKITGRNDRELKALHVLGDLIVLFLRLPLLKRVTPGGKLATKDFILYYLLAFKRYINGEDPGKDIYYSELDSADKINKYTPPEFSFKPGTVESKIINIFEESSKIVEEFIFKIPADNRPGYNISSLAIHQLASSAIAWSLMYSDLLLSNKLNENRIKLECLRLGALLHDIGKPFNWRHHVSESISRVRWLLSDILSEELINEVAELVGRHHERGTRDKWVEIIRKSDHVASNFDRLRDLMRSIIEDFDYSILNTNDPSEFKNLVKAWIFQNDWSAGDTLLERFGNDTLLKFNSIIVRKLRETSSVSPVSDSIISNLCLIKIDSRGIQRYIYATSELAELVFGSYLVDYIQSVEIPLKLTTKSGLPLENILFSAGGNIYILAPEQYIDTIKKIIEETYSRGLYEKLGATMVYEKIKTDFIGTLNSLENKSNLSKIIDSSPKFIDFSIFQKCSSCKISDADPLASINGEYLCVSCYGRRNLGKKIHFGWKWGLEISTWYRDKVKSEWEKIDHVLEFIAGHSIEEALLMSQKKFTGEYKSMSVIKIDGNAVGLYISNAVSLTHLIYKSFRIDLSTKKAFEKFFELLMSKDLIEDIWRVYLGILYIGGDDVLVIVPSYLAIPLVWTVIDEFVKGMGLDLTMSAGVITAKPRIHLWSLFESVEILLEKSKEASRSYRPVFTDGKVMNPGAITFLFWKSMSISKSYVDHLIDVEKSRELRASTFSINSSSLEEPDLIRLVSTILSDKDHIDINDLIERVKSISRRSDDAMVKFLKSLRSEILRVVGKIYSSNDMRNGLLYILRNLGRFRGNKEKEDLFQRVLELFRMHKEIYSHSVLLDALDLIDNLLGGVLE